MNIFFLIIISHKAKKNQNTMTVCLQLVGEKSVGVDPLYVFLRRLPYWHPASLYIDWQADDVTEGSLSGELVVRGGWWGVGGSVVVVVVGAGGAAASD